MVAGGDGRYDTNFNGEAYSTVSGQNTNNSVRIPNEFLEAVIDDSDWHLRWRTDGRSCKTLKARELWEKIGYAAWRCADPGVQFDATINEWHTCPRAGGSTPATRAASTCSSTTRRATWRAEPAAVPRRTTGALRYRGLPARDPPVDDRAGDQRADGAVPEQGDRAEIYEFRTLGLGYANLGTC